MGLIGWIKKEIESNSRQRRQSAPPPSLYNQNNETQNQHRDEAYMKAISRFNEWRNNQRFEKLNETKNASAITNAISSPHESIITADISISSLEIDDSEKRRLLEFRREQRRAKQHAKKLEHKVDFFMSQTHQRHSLPILKDSSDQKLNRRKSQKQNKIQPSNTIDEIEEFETNHCQDMDDFSMSVTSPPSKFYRENSEPYSEGKKKITPKKLMGRNMLRRGKSHGKGKAPPPPPVDSEASSGFRNGDFKRFEVISSSAYDEFVKQSNIYKASLRKIDSDKINSVGETGSSGSSSDEKNAKKTRRMSPPYLTVINKHGEEVEYALPYSERESLVTIPPLPDTPAPDVARIPPSQFDQIINENFNFLQTHLDFSNHENGNMRKTDGAFEPIYASFSEMPSARIKKVQITDLDRSNNTSLLKTPTQSGDIIKELDALSKWTDNLKNSIEHVGDHKSKSHIEDYLKFNENCRVFRSQDIKIKSGVLRNSQTLPLEFSFGFLHKTPITLRSTLPDVYNDNCIADIAIKKDYEVLSQIHHQNIAIMMGINYDVDLRVMSLIFEPFEFTLNYYLHQMDHYFAIDQSISIVIQIASAVQYLHESGFIHSNINSHTVLIRRSPFAVKLSSFELTTEILPRQSIEKIYRQKNLRDGEMSLMTLIPEEPELVQKYYKLSKHHFYNDSAAKEFPAVDYEKESRLAYLIDFRRKFSSHFSQAPELLPPKNDSTYKFVLPTIRSDVFSLGLLLWEILNHCIPFVIYNYDELSTAFSKNEASLPLLDKSCVSFMEIFNRCLHRNADERFSDVYQLIDMLNAADASCVDEKIPFKNITDKKAYNEKTPQKLYFKTNQKDPQKRAENAITAENILNAKSTKSFSESLKSSEMEAHVVSFSHQPEILHDDLVVNRIRKSLESQRSVPPKKPMRMKEDSPGMLDMDKRSESAMFQSFFDLNRLTTPKIDKNGIYERTSTLKKRTKVNPINKKSVKGLFDDKFDKMNSELEQIPQNDFMEEIKKEMNQRNHELSSFMNCGMQHSIGDVSRSTDDIRKTLSSLNTPIKRSESDNLTGNDNQMEDYRLPKTPIARQNRIRRNVWLSDSKKPSGGKISDEHFKPNKTASDVSTPTRNFNVSIKFHRNDLDKDEKEDSSSPLTKINNSEINNSKYNVDINKKYYPMMPEMLSDVIRNKRDKSISMLNCDDEKADGEIHSIAPIRSVRDAVKFIEATFTPNGCQSPTIRRSQHFEALPKLANEETQTEKFFLPQLRGIAVENEKDDEAKECMTKASQSIQKLSEIITTSTDNFPQIRQAQVTVNVQQITHRSSDIGQLKKLQEQSRHSICNSAELIKRFQMQIKSNSKSLCNVNKNDLVSASCSSLVAKSNDQISTNQPTGKCCKYFCRNCGFTMLPVELLQKMQSSGRLSLTSSVQSIKGIEDGCQLKRCPTITETRSTEDIYIDDDFCQGISQSLAANMELSPSYEFFDSLNINFLEFLQSQPHDWTTTYLEPQNNQLEWNGSDNEEETQKAEQIEKCEDVEKIEEVKIEEN